MVTVTQLSKHAEYIQSIAHLPIDEQIRLVKQHIRETDTWHEFVNDPALKTWIAANQQAINATMWGDNK